MIMTHRSALRLGIALIGVLCLPAALAAPPPPPVTSPPGGMLSCSNDAGQSNINEINFPGGAQADFVETFILENGVSVDGWKLCTQTAKNFAGGKEKVTCEILGAGNLDEYFYGNPQGQDDSPDEFNIGTYLYWDLPSSTNLNATFGEVLLVDENDAVIDYIRFCSDAGACDPGYWTVDTSPTGCGFVLPGHGANDKDVARIPDGTGDFTDNGTTTTIGDTNDDTPPTSLFTFTMDETAWNGTSGEVVDSEGVAAGTAVNGASTANTSPAVSGTPGTCGYGSFDGVDDYISVAVLPGGGIEASNALTLTGWVHTTSNASTQTIFSFQDGGDYLRLSVTPTGKLTYASNMTSPTSFSTADNTLANDTWYFVSLVVDPGNGKIWIYTATQAGSVTLADSANYSVSGEFEIEIENGGEVTLGGGSGLPSFNGFMDEVALFGGPLGTDSLDALKSTTRPCPVTGPNHYAISHDGNGLSCLAEAITITAHDDATPTHGTVNVPSGTAIALSAIDLGTSTARGTWSATPQSGTGSVTNISAGNGTATYTFPGGESSVTLLFNYTNPVTLTDSVNFDLIDGDSVTELKNTTEDENLQFGTAAFIFNNDTDANQTITTQIAGKDSDSGPGAKTLTIQAVEVNTTDPSQCQPLFANETVAIELGAECRNPTSCAGQQLSINGTTIPTNADNSGDYTTSYSSPALNLSFNASSKANIVINYPDAGQMQLHARHNILLDDGTPSGNYMYGNSNDFVVRPFGFAFTDIRNYGADTTYGNADDVLNPGGTASAGSGFIAAEDVFRVSIQGYQYDAADDSNSDGIPDIGRDISDNSNGTTPNFAWATDLSSYAASNFTPAGGSAGTLSGTTAIALGAYSGGSANSSGDLTYDEVGSITLQALATNYISAGVNVLGYSLPVGRFYPDHFTLESGSISPGCGAFTYMGQPFDITYNLEARGLNEGVPSNYDTAAGYTTATIALRAENNSDGTDMGARLANAGSSWSAGAYAINTSAAIFNRAASPDGAYTSLQLGLDITSELDSRDIENMDMLTNTAKAFGTTDVRYGRLRIGNAFGSELLPLAIPLFAEYYHDDGSGGAFMTNSNDSCTTYDALDATPDANAEILALADYIPNLDSGETTASGSGTIMNGTNDPANSIVLSAPGAGNDGSVDMTLSVSSWLLYDWDGDGTHDNDPTGTATFGIFQGNDATIYLRELY